MLKHINVLACLDLIANVLIEQSLPRYVIELETILLRSRNSIILTA